ncbi:hypothetical protein SAMCFNEI73_pC0238 (plasmid) [Sinorhizobium americanum]|uniref:Uncharacterized protein n=1 Tax=Sinorhizobium americanum TaxID=194963 RepID=A0A1L3LV32_9HYPH|nr:hypothetical protein SAMCFNEI73_pC0238 [Sinorhizobium americanum]
MWKKDIQTRLLDDISWFVAASGVELVLLLMVTREIAFSGN